MFIAELTLIEARLSDIKMEQVIFMKVIIQQLDLKMIHYCDHRFFNKDVFRKSLQEVTGESDMIGWSVHSNFKISSFAQILLKHSTSLQSSQ